MKTNGGKQTVGVHTDITFDLSDNKTDTKSTENDNEEVPVFLGTDLANGRAHVERRYDPSLNRPNFYDTNDDATGYTGGQAGTWVRLYPSINDWTTEKYSHATRKYKSAYLLSISTICVFIVKKTFVVLLN